MKIDKRRVQNKPLTEKQKKVLEGFRKHGAVRPIIVAKDLGYNEHADIQNQISSLQKRGLLQRAPDPKYSKYEVVKK